MPEVAKKEGAKFSENPGQFCKVNCATSKSMFYNSQYLNLQGFLNYIKLGPSTEHCLQAHELFIGTIYW